MSKKIKIGLFKSITKIDVKNGEMTLQQRIMLGEIISSGKHPGVILEECMICLHNYRPKIKELKYLTDYLSEIIEGLNDISHKESLLVYEPLVSEMARYECVNGLSDKSRINGLLSTLAERENKSIIEILSMKYSDYFNILKCDNELFNTRNKQILEN